MFRLIRTTAFFLYVLDLIAKADGAPCDIIDDFVNYNASKSYTIPALSFADENGGNLTVDEGKTWSLITRLHQPSGAVNDARLFGVIDTGDSKIEGMGYCLQQQLSYDISLFGGAYTFPKDVLERSVEDVGDCKVMLGEACVNALKDQYESDALAHALHGNCNEMNTTVPLECQSLISGETTWPGMGAIQAPGGSFANLGTYASDRNCTVPSDPSLLNSNMQTLNFQNAGAYAQSLRFPRPTFIAFWPNRTGETQASARSVHIEIMCLRPDEVREGSETPPAAKELLEGNDVKYVPELKDPDGNVTGEGDKPDSVGRVRASMGAVVLGVVLSAVLLTI